MASPFTSYRTNKWEQIVLLTQLKKLFRVADKWYMFPFYASNGTLDLTNNSIKTNDFRINDASTFEKIFIGNESIIYTWEDSVEISIENKGDQFHTKNYKVGKIFETAEMAREYTTNFGSFQEVYKSEQTTENHLLFIIGETFDISDCYKMYIVKNSNNETLNGAQVVGQDNQLFYISSLKNIYGMYNNQNAICQVIQLSSLNERLAQVGQTKYQSVLFAAMGSGYAFPLRQDNKWVLDENRLVNQGVTSTNINIFGNVIFSSIKFYGYPILGNSLPTKNKDGTYKDRIYNIRPLNFAWSGGSNADNTDFPKKNGGLLHGISNKIFSQRNLLPKSILGYLEYQLQGYENVNDWLTSMKEKFDIFIRNKFYGIVNTTTTPLIDINKDNLSFWDDKFVINPTSDPTLGNIRINGNSFFVGNNPDDKTKPFLSPSVVIQGDPPTFENLMEAYLSFGKDLSMQDIVNINSYININNTQLELSFQEIIPFGSNQFPAIGKFLNIISLGIPWGFTLHKNTSSLPRNNLHMGFMAKMYAQGINDLFGKDNLISLDYFDTNSNVGNAIGSSVGTMSFNATLTDKVKINVDGNKIVSSTMNLGQVIKKADGTYSAYLLDTEPQNFVDANTVLDADPNIGAGDNHNDYSQWYPTPNGSDKDITKPIRYVVTGVEIDLLGLVDILIDFSSIQPFDAIKNVYESIDYVIATLLIKSQGSFLNNQNVLAFKTAFSISDYPYKDEGKEFTYPNKIIPPSAFDVTQSTSFNIGSSTSISATPSASVSIDGWNSSSDSFQPDSPWSVAITYNSSGDGTVYKKIGEIQLSDFNNNKIKKFDDIITQFKSISINFSYKTQIAINANTALFFGSIDYEAYQNVTNVTMEDVENESTVDNFIGEIKLTDNSNQEFIDSQENKYTIYTNEMNPTYSASENLWTEKTIPVDINKIMNINNSYNNGDVFPDNGRGIDVQVFEKSLEGKIDNDNYTLTMTNTTTFLQDDYRDWTVNDSSDNDPFYKENFKVINLSDAITFNPASLWKNASYFEYNDESNESFNGQFPFGIKIKQVSFDTKWKLYGNSEDNNSGTISVGTQDVTDIENKSIFQEELFGGIQLSNNNDTSIIITLAISTLNYFISTFSYQYFNWSDSLNDVLTSGWWLSAVNIIANTTFNLDSIDFEI